MADQTPASGHNLQSLSADINQAFAKTWSIDQQLRASAEPLKEQKKKVWRDLKTSTGIDGKDLRNLYRNFAREQEIKDFDEDDRIRVQDNLRRLYEAAKVGETLDFMDVLERVEKTDQATRVAPIRPKDAKTSKAAKKAAKKGTPAPSDAYKLGYQAGSSAKGSRDDNPYDELSAAYHSWQKGWDNGQFDNAKKIKGPTPAEA